MFQWKNSCFNEGKCKYEILKGISWLRTQRLVCDSEFYMHTWCIFKLTVSCRGKDASQERNLKSADWTPSYSDTSQDLKLNWFRWNFQKGTVEASEKTSFRKRIQQVGTHHRFWRSEEDNGLEYCVLMVTSAKLNPTFGQSVYNLGKKR